MKIAIIGGGFTGLAAAYTLTKNGHHVTVYEAGPMLGGLAYGFKEKNWDWSLEYAYHHWFTNDRAIMELTHELGLTDKLLIRRPVTASLYKGKSYPLDSPLNLFLFPGLSVIDKFRTAALLAYLKINPFWKPLENITAEHLLTSIGGIRSYQVLWEPLLTGKFDTYADKVSAAWFWARIKKRTPSLAYMKGGFRTLIDTLAGTIKKQGGKIFLNNKLTALPHGFDRILVTVPTPIAQKLIPNLTAPHVNHLWAQTLILETKEPILRDIYWLNVTDRTHPFLAVVAHTNFMEKKNYGNHHLTYFGNYLPQGHKYLSMTKEKLLKEFLPYIKRLSYNSKFVIYKSYLFTGPFAQPVHELHYSQKVPPFHTPDPSVFLANMDSVVPWDRGTNYAVELGIRAATALF
jgi:protoporphyrinogen oxidase